MPLNQLKKLQIAFLLLDEKSKPKALLPVFIQYYEVVKNEWITIYNETIEKGFLRVEKSAIVRAKALALFFKTIKNNQIPELRIVAKKKLYKIDKFQVLASMYAFHYDEKNSALQFDFGTGYLLTEEFLRTQKGFRNFIVVTSPYPITTTKVIEKQKDNDNQTLNNHFKKCVADKNKLRSELTRTNAQLKEKEKQFRNISKNVENLQNQNKKFLQAHSNLNEQLNSLKKEANNCKKKLEKSNSDLVKAQKLNKQLNSKILELEKKIIAVNNFLTETKKELKRLTAIEKKYNKLNTELGTSNENNNSIKKELEQCKKQYAELEKKQDRLIEEKQDYLQKVEIFNSEKKQLEEVNSKANEKVISLDSNLKEVKKNLSEKENKINELNLKVEELGKNIEFDTRPMPVSGVYSNIVNEIELAETRNNSNFKLANIQLKLKTLVNRDKEGLNLQFLNYETAKEVNGNSISEVVIDIESTPRQIVEPGNLPSLIGFTETAVRRILSNLNLRLNPVYQKNEKVPSGESFKQSPSVNEDIQNNQLITVIFSKNE